MKTPTHGGKRSGAGRRGDRANRLCAQWLATSYAVTIQHARRLLREDPDHAPSYVRTLIEMGIEVLSTDEQILLTLEP